MEEIYLLVFDEENDGYTRIYGVYNDYILADETMRNLKKYNETIDYGEFKILPYTINELYKKRPNEIK